MKKALLISVVLFSFLMIDVNAQDIPENSNNSQNLDLGKNNTLIKVNLTSIPFKNYSFQLERTLSKTISLSVAYRIMPTGHLPFTSQIINLGQFEDQDEINIIENMNVGNFAITPEIRFYLGKGYGQGFYISVFFRHMELELNNISIDFEGENGGENTIDLTGDVKTNTAGILMGAQWSIGKHFCVDWWILGAHYGVGLGNINAVSDQLQLSQSEQDDIEQQLNDIDIPFSDATVDVAADRVSLKIDGPWAGIRAGLSFGFKF